MITKIAQFRFYEELNDFLPLSKRKLVFPYHFTGSPSIKDAIEAIGVPHTEVDLILINGKSVDFSHPLQAGDYISVYPVFETLDITPLTHLRPKPLRITQFILDVHLGRLAHYLRLLGFDTLYENHFTDEEIIHLAKQKKRIILTRDKGLLKNNDVTRGYWLRTTDPKFQVKEVLHRFNLSTQCAPFSRCLECNGKIAPVSKTTIAKKLPQKTNVYYQSFYRCKQCKKIYWEGSHYQKMRAFVEDVLGIARAAAKF